MATAATDILQQILTAQGRRTIDGAEAVRRILEEVRKQVIGEIASAAPESFTAYRQSQMLQQLDRLLYDAEAGIRVELGRGINAAWEAGRDLLPQMATAAGTVLSPIGISSHLVDQLKEFTWGRISAITNDAQAKIRAELTLGVLGQKTPMEIAGKIAGYVDEGTFLTTRLGAKGVFENIAARAEVITKTELGRTFSMAHQASMEAAAPTLPGLEKMWLHAGHPKRARIYHMHNNGQTRPVAEPFLIGGIIMMYPRDPTAPASEVVNCGCMHVAYMPGWGSKKEFLTSWEKAQVAANKPRR